MTRHRFPDADLTIGAGSCSPRTDAVGVRYARWDGGPLEVAKASMSGWYYMNDPKAIEATCKWYDGEDSLELLRMARVNWIWITFSSGFSPRTESRQWRILDPFVRRCRDNGIGVSGYMSLTNVFIDDMGAQFPDIEQWLQVDAQGQAIPYGAARYVGAPSRYLACLTNENWRQLLLDRMQAALDMGIDGFAYDNVGNHCRCSRCSESWRKFACEFGERSLPWPEAATTEGLCEDDRERVNMIHSAYRTYSIASVFEVLRARINAVRPSVLLYGNFHARHQAFTVPANSAISTEDGLEPGIVEGEVRSNTGLLRCVVGAGAGVRPVRIEYGRGRMLPADRKIDAAGVGASRFVPMSAEHHQLALAEAYCHGASLEICPEGEFLTDLFFRTDHAMNNWHAISQYNEFFAEHKDLYENTHTATKLVAVLNCGFCRMADDEPSPRIYLINELVARGVILDVLYDIDVSDERLAGYDTMLLPDTRVLDDVLLNTVRTFVKRGGRIIATGQTGQYNERFLRLGTSVLKDMNGVMWLADPSRGLRSGTMDETNFDVSRPVGADSSIISFSTEAMDILAAQLLPAAALPVQVNAPPTVRYNMTRDRKGRLVVHLLNYADQVCNTIDISGRFDQAAVELFSPDRPLAHLESRGPKGIRLSHVARYAVIRLGMQA